MSWPWSCSWEHTVSSKWSSRSLPYPFRFLVAVEHTLAVQLEAIGTFIHAFKHRRRRLTHHWDAAPLFPGSIIQALYLQELTNETWNRTGHQRRRDAQKHMIDISKGGQWQHSSVGKGAKPDLNPWNLHAGRRELTPTHAMSYVWDNTHRHIHIHAIKRAGQLVLFSQMSHCWLLS